MLVDVTPLRSKGKRLRKSELQPPSRGLLRIDYGGTQTSFKRPMLTANLQIEQGVQRTLVSILQPIFDVLIVNLVDNQFSLTGVELSTEIDGDDRRIVESVQVWRCALVLDGSEPPQREVFAKAAPTSDKTAAAKDLAAARQLFAGFERG